MMLLMLVSLTTFAQYPTTKKIKGTPVVIMTVPQAEKINSKFGMLEDSIAALNSKLQTKTTPLSINRTMNPTFSFTESIRLGTMNASVGMDSTRFRI